MVPSSPDRDDGRPPESDGDRTPEDDGDRTPEDDGDLPRDPATVRRTYDRIADHFAKTRHSPWPEVRAFVDGADPGDIGLDLGCGNGRHAAVLAERVRRVLCVDASRSLLGIARERLAESGGEDGTPPLDVGGWTTADAGEATVDAGEATVDAGAATVDAGEARAGDSGGGATGDGTGGETAAEAVRIDPVQADAATLPVRDGRVDLAAYVATVHHLPDRSRRVRSLDELARVLAPGGRALVSAWATTHDRFDREEGFDTTVDWTLPDGETVDRFYHVYDPDEFAADLAESDLRVGESWVAKGNCYAEVGPPDGE